MEKTKDLEKAIVYVRVSTEEQAKKGYSIDGQEKICCDYAVGMGYEVIKVFKEEGRSAKDLNRPEIKEMFKYIKQNYKNIDALIFWKWDRLSRGEEEDYVELYKVFKKYNIKPLSTMENNDNSPEANLMRKITFATSKYELDKDSQRTQMGMRCKAEIDYIIQVENEIIPVEVKATTNLKAKSLSQFRKDYNPDKAIRTSLADYEYNTGLYNIPLYAINSLIELVK